MNDGLTEILQHFGIDDNIDQELIIDMQELENRFLITPYDKLCTILQQL